MAERGPVMTALRFTSIIVCVVLLGQGSSEKIGECVTQVRRSVAQFLFIPTCDYMIIT